MEVSMKKHVVMGMIALMAVGSVMGCGKNNDGSSTAGSSAETTKAESKSSEKEESDSSTISVMAIDWGYGPIQNSEMEKYWEDLLGVNLDIEFINYEDYDQKVNTLISSGSIPDVIQVSKMGNGSYYYPVFTQAIEAGDFVDLTPYLFDNGKGIAETNSVMKNWEDTMWDQTKYKDGIYILPRSKAESGQNSGIEVRKDLIEKYGFEKEPATMDELKDWLIQLSKAASDGEGKKIYALEFFGDKFMDDRVKAFATAFTGQSDWAVDENGEFQYMQFKDEYIDFLDWMKALYDADAIDPEFALNNSDTSKWKAGNSVALLSTWYNWNQSSDLTSSKIFDDSTPDDYKAWCLMPVKGSKAYTVSPNYTDVDSCIAISADCSKEKIEKILAAFDGTEEQYTGYDKVMAFGVEGIHYVLKEDGTIDNSEEVAKESGQNGYVGAWNQIFLKKDADMITDKFMREGAKRASDENITRVKEIKDFVYTNLKETGMKNETQNLQSDTYNKQWSVLTDDVNTMCTQYIMGQIDEKDWKSFIKEIVDSADYKAIQNEFKESAKEAE